MNTRRIALVGLGAAARGIHLPALRKLAGFELVGGHDPAIAVDPALSFPLYPSLDELFDRARPDVVAVLTPPEHHLEVARAALEAGCHVICEKPFAPDLEEARAVVGRAQKLGRWIVVNNQYRFMTIHQAARSAVGSVEMGELLFLEARQTFVTDSTTEEGWRGRDPRRTCKEFGTHVLDLCRFFFDAEPCSVRARMPRPLGAESPELLDLIELEFPGDRFAQITLDRLSRGPHRYLELRLDGERATVETRLGGGLALSLGIRGGRRRRPFAELDVSGGGRALLYRDGRSRSLATDPLDVFAAATRRLLAGFLEALDAGREPPGEAGDNLRTLALMEAAYRSAETRRAVRLGDDGFPRDAGGEEQDACAS